MTELSKPMSIEEVLYIKQDSIQTGPRVPGDLSQRAPLGDGFYGHFEAPPLPFKEAPPTEAIGGHLFFDSGITEADFMVLTHVLGLDTKNPNYAKKYVTYLKDAEKPLEEGYVRQIRFVDEFALKFLYRTHQSETQLSDQPLTIPEAMWAFIKDEERKYGTMFGGGLSGKFGGNGGSLQEALSFGIMVENSYHGISRIWSRGWLVGK